ncbi:helix-turn-helix transcriptional regulator [Actinocatenispora rupis]|uniref:Transcriptional regulator n=1 Tax=Actinocatenispora rupis TaxID=519421 RepID=A0A8J3J3J4_9ACTN|nr:WYL domain-containing protein [Actinocatenispora rupis]GID09489.1 transcriptional regulator [Actinocatenispora rupis]
MRASRLLSLLLLLQTRGRLTARELAAELEVSVRTIYRDAESLSAAGIPLYADAGPGGGYQLLDGYRTRLTGLTGDEAEALFLAGLPGPAAELGLGAVVTAAALKLRAALPPELRDRADLIRQRFHLDAPGWYRDADQVPYLAAVASAVWEQRRIRVTYRRWREPTDVDRTLRPYGVVLKAGTWYLVAGGADTPEPRTYKVNQILDLTTLDAGFERPTDFDLPAYWRDHISDFRTRLYTGEAVVRLSPRGRRRLAEMAADPVTAAVDRTAGAPDEAGWVTVTIPIESLPQAEADLLRLGPHAEVRSPADLRERLARAARDLAALYA